MEPQRGDRAALTAWSGPKSTWGVVLLMRRPGVRFPKAAPIWPEGDVDTFHLRDAIRTQLSEPVEPLQAGRLQAVAHAFRQSILGEHANRPRLVARGQEHGASCGTSGQRPAERGAAYLRPVLATPWTKYFWNSAKTSSIGRIAKKDMANSGPKSLPNWLIKNCRPTGRV